jgi:hypothetical protein
MIQSPYQSMPGMLRFLRTVTVAEQYDLCAQRISSIRAVFYIFRSPRARLPVMRGTEAHVTRVYAWVR